MEALQRRIELLEVDLSRKVDQLQMDIDRIKQISKHYESSLIFSSRKSQPGYF